jgi:nucleotidyltransferase substrate binding protein (TIGR01987 family)
VNPDIGSFNKALVRLAEALDAPASDLVRDASIQRFEFTSELAWKAIKNTVTEEGLECVSPRSCLKLAFGQGWIENESIWLVMLEDRNRASHTYDEKLAEQLYGRLPDYLDPFRGLLEILHRKRA